MGTNLLTSTVFHPKTDGVTEWANHSICHVLQALVCNDQKNWAELCPIVDFTLNSNISSTTGYALFKLNCGYIPQTMSWYGHQVYWCLAVHTASAVELNDGT